MSMYESKQLLERFRSIDNKNSRVYIEHLINLLLSIRDKDHEFEHENENVTFTSIRSQFE